jgi:hypothetical protein
VQGKYFKEIHKVEQMGASEMNYNRRSNEREEKRESSDKETTSKAAKHYGSWRVPQGNQSELASGYPVEARFNKKKRRKTLCSATPTAIVGRQGMIIVQQGVDPVRNRKEKD